MYVMGMGIGIHAEHPDVGKVQGCQEPVACGVWFTSNGEPLPKMLKFKGEDGEIYTLDHIQIHSREKKYFCGILAVEYRCSTLWGGRTWVFRLLFYPEECRWNIIWETPVVSKNI
jgi:hypothetical protein